MQANNPVATIKKESPFKEECKCKEKCKCNALVFILKGDQKYEEKREIVNLRFDYKPYGIALCQCAEHVKYCIESCVKYKVKLRIRSGGHHHEGMSSAKNILLIDLSNMYCEEIEYADKNKDSAWIPPGKKLACVYKELEKEGRILPGGICDSVNVGGLSQGVGWGVSTRKFGYTSDNIIAIEIVKADGGIVIASNDKDNEYKDLFWAIRGGGGGNFGVITRFKFKLSRIADVMTKFVFTYAINDTEAAAHKWANFEVHLDGTKKRKADENVTIGGRLSVEKEDGAKITLAGLYYGSLLEAQATLEPLLNKPKPIKEEYTIINKVRNKSKSINKFKLETAEYSLAATLSSLGDIFNPTAPKITKSKPVLPKYFNGIKVNSPATEEIDKASAKALLDTCNGRHSNKVSSAFPKDNKPETIKKLMATAVAYIKASKKYSDLNNYVSLHGIGGNSREEPAGGTPYPFRDRPFLFKIQAWWNFTTDEAKNKEYVKWVRDFKTAIAPYTDGAFINFQDKDLVENPNTPEGKIALLTHYYKEHLPRLREVKSKHDPDNLFEFGMSIPPS